MQTKKGYIGADWEDFETFINQSAGTSSYRIFNRGIGTILLQENTSQPAAGNDDGEPLIAGKYVTFQKGTSNLYMRAESNITGALINVTEVEENA